MDEVAEPYKSTKEKYLKIYVYIYYLKALFTANT